MRTTRFPLPKGSYVSSTPPESMQRLANLRWQGTESDGTRSPEKLQTLPGLKPFVEVDEPGNCRGVHNAEGKLLSVLGRTLYRISTGGVAIPIGTLPGNGRVQLAHNQISLGNEVLAVNGSAGYLWNSVTNAYGRVTDEGFPGGSSVRFVSQYFVVIEPQGRFAASSSPAAGGEWNTLDRWTSEASPDPLVAQGVRGNELLLLSTTSGEFFQATAASRQPFRTKGINFKNAGAAGPHVVCEADGNIFWLGADGVFYALNGYSPQRISDRALEAAITDFNLSSAFAFLWDTVVYWCFPDGITVGFDFAQRQWHDRLSPDLIRWRVNAMTRWNGRWIAGDFQRNRLWDCNLEDKYWLEGSDPYIKRFTMGVMADDENAIRMPRLALNMDRGQQPTVPVGFDGQPVGPTLTGPTQVFAGVGDTFDEQWGATGGTPPYRFSLAQGEVLPDGGELSTDGALSGSPTTVGETPSRLRVTDANDLWDEGPVTFYIVASPVSIITNSHFYTGLPGDLELGDSMGWAHEPYSQVSGSPDGLYAAGAQSGVPVVANRLEIRAWDSATQGFVDVDPPVEYPDIGPRGLAWHPTEKVLACTGTHGVAGEDFILYDYSSGLFVAMDPPVDLPEEQSNFCRWDREGNRLAISSTYSANVISIYDFEDGALGAMNDGLNLGTGDLIASFRWRPEDNTRYIAALTATRLFVIDVVANPPTVVASVIVGISGLMGPIWTTEGDHIIVADPNTTPNFFKVYTFNDTPGSESLTATVGATIEQPGWVPTGLFGIYDNHMAVRRQTVSDNYPPYIWRVTGSPPVLDKIDDPDHMGAVLSAMAFAFVPETDS